MDLGFPERGLIIVNLRSETRVCGPVIFGSYRISYFVKEMPPMQNLECVFELVPLHPPNPTPLRNVD